MGTTPTKATQGLSPNGGIALHEAPTRRWHAARGLHVVQNPHERGHGGHRRDRRAWPWRRRDRKAGLRGTQDAVPVAGGAWPDNEPKRRSKLAARTDRGADGRSGRHRHHRQPNFARNLSRSFFEMPKHVAIPTTQIQCLNQSSRNYVRNCWLTAIAGHQGNAPSRRTEPPIEAHGTDGSRAAHGAARSHGPARLPENPRAHKQQPASHSNT